MFFESPPDSVEISRLHRECPVNSLGVRPPHLTFFSYVAALSLIVGLIFFRHAIGL